MSSIGEKANVVYLNVGDGKRAVLKLSHLIRISSLVAQIPEKNNQAISRYVTNVQVK